MLKGIVFILTLTVLIGGNARGDEGTDTPKVGDLLFVVLTGDAASAYSYLTERLPNNTTDQVPSMRILARVTQLEGTEIDFEHKRTVICNLKRFETILAGRIPVSQMQRKCSATDTPISDSPNLYLRLNSFSALAQFRLEHRKRNEETAD